jgi:hypothetical protein
LGVIFQILFLLLGLGLTFLLLYYGFRSSGKGQKSNINQKDLEIKGKFIGRT